MQIKFLLALVLILTLLSPVVFAQSPNGGSQSSSSGAGQTDQGTGQGQQVQTEQNTSNQGAFQNLTVQTQTKLRTRARNVTELREMIQERQQEMNQEMLNLTQHQQNIYQNQNRVRLAVHAFLAMENLTGGIGQNVSQIAREFNNSIQATIRAEERIQVRNMLVKFFMGGDQESAGEIEQEVNRNQLRIQSLEQLRDQCNCTTEVRVMIQEQIQNMQLEQTRLQELSQNEIQNRGLFGWMFGWMKK